MWRSEGLGIKWDSTCWPCESGRRQHWLQRLWLIPVAPCKLAALIPQALADCNRRARGKQREQLSLPAVQSEDDGAVTVLEESRGGLAGLTL